MSARLAQYRRLSEQRRAAIAVGDDVAAQALEREMKVQYEDLDDTERGVLSMGDKRRRR